jgi:hypothetical protein
LPQNGRARISLTNKHGPTGMGIAKSQKAILDQVGSNFPDGPNPEPTPCVGIDDLVLIDGVEAASSPRVSAQRNSCVA